MWNLLLKKPRIILLAGLLFLLKSISINAQKPNTFTITTNPSDATVYLSGEYKLVANTPAELPEDFSGKYKIKIVRRGYESWKGTLTLPPGNDSNIVINLSQKSRIKAGLRSFIIPGWGQHYGEGSVRAKIYSISTLSAIAGALFFEHRYQDKRKVFDSARAAYLGATSSGDRERLKPISDAAQRTAYNAETDRRASIAIAGSIWAANVLDAVIFFNNGKANLPSIEPTTTSDGATLTFTVKF